MDDFSVEDELRRLMASVYVTPRQREALRRTVQRMVATRGLARPALRARAAEPEDDVIEEDRRHALLGPCGAE